MENAYEEIYTLLQEQRSIQESLLNLSYEKRQVIVNNNVDRLNEIVQEELKLLSKVKNTEKKRISALGELPCIPGMTENDWTLSSLVRNCPANMRERFSLLQTEFTQLMKTQQEINDLNKALLETQLDYTEAMLNISIDAASDQLNNLYGVDGKMKDDRRSAGFLDDIIV